MKTESQPTKATIAIVTDEGTVFEAEGLMEVEYRSEIDESYAREAMRAGLTAMEAARLPDLPVLVVTARIRGFEGSITVPPEMVA